MTEEKITACAVMTEEKDHGLRHDDNACIVKKRSFIANYYVRSEHQTSLRRRLLIKCVIAAEAVD